jgi:hypothetical protein
VFTTLSSNGHIRHNTYNNRLKCINHLVKLDADGRILLNLAFIYIYIYIYIHVCIACKGDSDLCSLADLFSVLVL